MLRTALGQIPLIAWICAGIVSTLVIADILAFSLMDIQLDVASLIPYLCAEVGLLVLVAYYVCFRDEPFLRDTLLAAYLTLAFTHAYSPLMYALATVAMPLQDDILLSFDVLIGVDVPSVALWAQDHPRLHFALTLAYNTFAFQLAAIPAFLGLFQRDREAMWGWLAVFQISAVVCLICFVLFPALGPFHNDIGASSVGQALFLEHMDGLRSGERLVASMSDMTGLITAPSFHAVVAIASTWAVRRSRFVFPIVMVINTMMLCSTITSGWHYVFDVLAGVIVALGTIALWRWASDRLPLIDHKIPSDPSNRTP